MNPKTEDRRPSDFSPMFVRWLIALTIMTLLLAFFSNRSRGPEITTLTPISWVAGGGITISHGLIAFRGLPAPELSPTDHVSLLGGVLLALVIGPALLLFSWRRLATGAVPDRLSAANIGFFFGAIVTTFYAVTTISAAIIQPHVADSMRSAQALGANRDHIIAGMSHIAFDAGQYRMRPEAQGGGGGSFVGYSIPANLVSDDGGRYDVTDRSDSTITILGSSREYEGSSISGTYGPGRVVKSRFVFHGQFQ